MINITAKSTGNITGNTYAIGSATLCNASPQIFYGINLQPGQVAWVSDGAGGTRLWQGNAAPSETLTIFFDSPLYAKNGIFVNTAAAANTIIYYG